MGSDPQAPTDPARQKPVIEIDSIWLWLVRGVGITLGLHAHQEAPRIGDKRESDMRRESRPGRNRSLPVPRQAHDGDLPGLFAVWPAFHRPSRHCRALPGPGTEPEPTIPRHPACPLVRAGAGQRLGLLPLVGTRSWMNDGKAQIPVMAPGLCRPLWVRRMNELMLQEATATESFTRFARDAEPRIRHALIPLCGVEAAEDATAEALEYAWKHWSRLQGNGQPRWLSLPSGP